MNGVQTQTSLDRIQHYETKLHVLSTISLAWQCTGINDTIIPEKKKKQEQQDQEQHYFKTSYKKHLPNCFILITDKAWKKKEATLFQFRQWW